MVRDDIRHDSFMIPSDFGNTHTAGDRSPRTIDWAEVASRAPLIDVSELRRYGAELTDRDRLWRQFRPRGSSIALEREGFGSDSEEEEGRQLPLPLTTERDRIIALAEKVECGVYDPPGDGHCGYAAVLEGIDLGATYIGDLREAVAARLEAQRDRVTALHLLEGTSFSAFVRGVRGTAWAQEAVLMALSDLLQVPIAIVTAQRHHPTMVYVHRPGFDPDSDVPADRALVLGYVGSNHFVVLKPHLQ
jgi:hypothetical protein